MRYNSNTTRVLIDINCITREILKIIIKSWLVFIINFLSIRYISILSGVYVLYSNQYDIMITKLRINLFLYTVKLWILFISSISPSFQKYLDTIEN